MAVAHVPRVLEGEYIPPAAKIPFIGEFSMFRLIAGAGMGFMGTGILMAPTSPSAKLAGGALGVGGALFAASAFVDFGGFFGGDGEGALRARNLGVYYAIE